jgi:Family of unknown function (DUF5829)
MRMRSLIAASVTAIVAFAPVSATLLAQTVPPVYFNHVTLFLAPAVYTAIAQSPFLRNEFSASGEQTVQADGGAYSYTRFYLDGQHTYLELLKPGDMGPIGTTVAGQMWFNMWVDDRNQLPVLRDRLAAENGIPMLIHTTRNARNEPSYDSVNSEVGPARDPGLVKTVPKGYYPDGITREKRLEKNFLPDRLLREVTGFHVTVSDEERKQLTKDFRAYSYTIYADGEDLIASGPQIMFTLLPEKPNAPRILTIDLAMKGAAGEKTYKFGGASELRIQGSAARWVFTLPSN